MHGMNDRGEHTSSPDKQNRRASTEAAAMSRSEEGQRAFVAIAAAVAETITVAAVFNAN